MSAGPRRVRRIALLVALAALVPVSAFALDGGAPSSAGGGLSVSASLGGCGVANSGIYCSIDVSFSGVPGADYYTASVSGPGGGVQDFGQVGQGESGGGTSLYVPYVGAGTYTVQVAAYGTPPDADAGGRPRLLDQGTADTPSNGFQPVPDGPVRHSAAPNGGAPDNGAGDGQPDAQQAPADDATPADPSTPPADAGSSPAPDATSPTETTPAPATDPAPAPTVTLPECQAAAAAADPSADASSESAAPAAAPPAECTTPSQDAQGSCCPPGG